VDDSKVARWLDDYVAAWRTYDEAAIASLFSENAVYRYRPWDEGADEVRGPEAIVASWLEDQDAPDTWSAEYRPWLVDGDRAVVTGVSRYFGDESSAEQEYHNVFLLRFDSDGRCREFTELYMARPT
jgi:ketosteroid isomerase-like protein